MMKRVLCFVLALVMACGMACPAFAAGEPEGPPVIAVGDVPVEPEEPAEAEVPEAPAETEEPVEVEEPVEAKAPVEAEEAPAAAEEPAAPTKAAALAAPVLTGAKCVAGGVQVTWNAVDGAEKYRVFYKTTGGWKKAGDAEGTSYVWTGAKSGTKYAFTVRCVTADGSAYASGYDAAGKSVKYIAAPKLGKVSASADGIKITWGAVSGAAKYRVYYKTTGGWKKIKDVTGTSYTWTGGKNGTAYAFTVKAYDSKGAAGGYDGQGRSLTLCAAPKLGKVSAEAGGVKITWSAVKGAEKYRVFYKTTGGWKKAGDAEGTSYTWKGAKSGTKYTFTVRCVTADGSAYAGGYDTAGKALTYIAAPKLTKVSAVAGGIKVTWGAVSGAAKYRVFYKTSGGKWTKAGDTDKTSYTWTKGASGKSYSFTVRCLTKDGKSYASAYDSTGLTLRYLAAPSLRPAVNTSTGIRISWDAVAGAVRYRVFYKSGGSWKKLADTADTSYLWTGGKSGTKYTFTVRAYDSDGAGSPYDKTGQTSAEGIRYVLNIHTMKFHYPECRDVPKIDPENRVDTGADRTQLIGEGYMPCGHCNP